MRRAYGHSRDAVYFLAPKRAGGWRVVKVIEHGPYHDKRPASWKGPYASEHAAILATPSEPHTVSMDPPTPENDPVGRFQWTHYEHGPGCECRECRIAYGGKR